MSLRKNEFIGNRMDLKTIGSKVQNAPTMLAWRLMMVFFLFSVQRVLFYLFNIGYFPHMPIGHLCELMLSGLKFDLSAVLYVNSLYILVMLLPIQLKYDDWYKKMARILFLFTNSIALLTNFIDIVYFRYILRRTDFSVFSEFRHESHLWKIILVGLVQYWYLVVIFAVMFYFLLRVYSDHKRSNLVRSNILFYLFSTFVLLLSVGLSVAGMRGGFTGTTRPITISNAIVKVQRPIESAIVLNTPFSMIRTIDVKTFEEVKFFEEKEAENIFEWKVQRRAPFGLRAEIR